MLMQSPVSDRYLSKRQVAEMTNFSINGIDRLVKQGRFPAPVKLSARGRCRWREGAVREFLRGLESQAAADQQQAG